nr:SRPBCC domain-containing protein [Allomuricauda sp.]
MIILIVLIFTGKKSVHHEITINASPEKVWGVLTDMNAYDEWNPTMKLIKGEVKVGNKVTYEFTQDAGNSYEVPIKVKEILPNKLLNQSGGTPLFLTYNHKYILEKQDDVTKVIINEDYNGIGVNFWNPEPVEKAYRRLNIALKERVENL